MQSNKDMKTDDAKKSSTPSTPPEEKILVVSLDWDGALAHNLSKLRELKSAEEKQKQIIKDNEALIKQIAEKAIAGHYKKVILMVGSNRQAWAEDFFASFHHAETKGTGSCFPVYDQLRDAIETKIREQPPLTSAKDCPHVEFDAYLLADTYRNQYAGTAFTHAKKFNASYFDANAFFDEYLMMLNAPIETQSWFYEKFFNPSLPAFGLFDHTKITLLYVQMQRMASQNPGKNIDFLFLDDSLKILDQLNTFYEKHRDLIPDSLSFNWFWYNGNVINLQQNASHSPICGLSKVDELYEKNLLTWAAVTLGILKSDKNKMFKNNCEIDFNHTINGADSMVFMDVLRLEIYKNIYHGIGAILGEKDYTHTLNNVMSFKYLKALGNKLATEINMVDFKIPLMD